MNLKGFYPYDFSLRAPSFSITENGVTFNAGVTKLIHFPAFAVLYVNEQEKLIILKAAKKGEKNAKAYFDSNSRKSVQSVRWNHELLRQTVLSLIGCSCKEMGCGFRIPGSYVSIEPEGTPAVLFEMKKAVKIC